HEHRPQPSHCPFPNAGSDLVAAFPKEIEKGNHDQPVQNSDSAKRNETHCGRDAKRQTAQGQGEHPSSDRQGNAGIHQQCLPQTTKGHKYENEDKAKSNGDDDAEPSLSLLQVFKLTSELYGITLWKLDLFTDFCLGFEHETFHVAPAQVHHDCGAALAELAGN